MSTHANQGTGYGRIANKITNHLAEQGHNVTFFAFQNYPGQNIPDRFIDPRIRFVDAHALDPESPSGFGDKAILPAFNECNPDVLFLYNDLCVCTAILELLGNISCKVICYLDLVYPFESSWRIEKLRERCDLCYTFLDCWREHLVNDFKWEPSKVKTLYHGVDFDRFSTVPKEYAREKLGIPKDDFVILNMNRNSYRKQWDVTIKAFVKLLIMNNMDPKLKLFCGCRLVTDDGFDLEELIKIESIRNDVNLEGRCLVAPGATILTDETVNFIYNACDVGLNTCCGEGFGLTTLEHASLKKPQVVTDVPALRETLRGAAYFVKPKIWSSMCRFDTHGGDIAHVDPKDFAIHLDRIYHNKDLRECNPSHIDMYSWSSVLKNLVL